MTNTVASPGPFDPIADSRPDEPVFPLVGRDPDAPKTIRFWADTRRTRLSKEMTAKKPPSEERMKAILDDLIRCTEADEIAHDMDRWRKGQPEQDTSGRGKATYNEVQQSAETIAEADRRRLIASARQGLREAAYYASEARDALMKIGELAPEHAVAIEEALARINALADAHEAVRPGYIPPLDLRVGEGVP